MTTLKPFDIISSKTDVLPKLGYGLFWLALFVASLGAGKNAYAQVSCSAANTITANVVVLDNPTVFNRLGAQNPNWIMYALERDVVDRTTQTPCSQTACTAGNVELRRDKRPRPLVIRSVAESCLTVNFTNLLAPIANPNNNQQNPIPLGTREPDPALPFQGLINNDQVAGRCAGFHASGTELVNGMEDDGSMVGVNAGASTADSTGGAAGSCGTGGLVAPGESHTYALYTPHEGAFIINSYGATLGSEANSGNLGIGMFGALNVQPKGAKLYRSQVTEEELRLATRGTVPSSCTGAPGEVSGVDCNPGGQPIIDYEALYPPVEPWISEGKAGLPILNMLTAANELVHSDINAIIAGPDADGSWREACNGTAESPASDCPYPLESVGFSNPAYPNRLEPFREFTSIYHDEQTNSQVFPNWYNHPTMRHVLHGVKDQFMINYGSGGIGSEIIANRLRTGPMHDCTDCAYEEFFLASQTVGDPAMLVKFPANTGIEACNPENIAAGPAAPNACWRDANLANGPIPENEALYQEDPSNVHHAYTGDFVKYRNTHAGAFEQHIFHFHNHQWLFNPNDDNANYLDAQEIMPGSGHTYELVNGGAGNRNHTTGDAIFHCHFYPHFAQGMWYHQRNHDVFETGTVLAVSGGTPENPGIHNNPFDLQSGKPMAGSRALPDGELPDGSPIPAVVPLPGKPMPQMPAAGVKVMAVDRGAFSLLGGRSGPDGIPDSSQAVVDYGAVAGADGVLGNADDVTPGFPFWLAGNECGELTAAQEAAGECPQGIVGQRMPTPPLDMLTEAGAIAQAGNDFDNAVDWSNLGGGHDGGLPRHALLGYTAGGLSLDTQNRLSFSKIIEMAQPVYFPEIGTELERVSMRYQAVRNRPSAANNLVGIGVTAGDFVLNGSPPVPGGPYNDPCVDDRGRILRFTDEPGEWYDGDKDRWGTLKTRGTSSFDGENPRTYKIANLQIDAVFNKVGYHYPQERIIILWEDVAPTIAKIRPPEPLVMRFNTFDCGKLLHANLVPHEFELDDFQVRTPTDIIGQHIHLPKWDLTTNDGAANGWNYEDGALAPGIVEERIAAINKFNKFAGTIVGPNCTLAAALAGDTVACPIPGMLAPIDMTDLAKVPTIDTGDPGSFTTAGMTTLEARPHPFFGNGIAGQHYTGARTVIQRLLVDPVVNVKGVDRGLGLTFSHDHYGPSTFQQIGLYSTILAEPAGSTWVHNETGNALNTRHDGGPTTWQAAILPPSAAVSTVGSEDVPAHREFYFEMSDFQHAYEAGVYVGADENGVPQHAEIAQVDQNGEPAPFNATTGIVTAPAPGLDDPRTSWLQAVNPTLKLTANGGVNPGAFPDTVNAHPGCPGRAGQNDPAVPRPCPEAINIGHSSMWVVNYRNEPVGLRVFDPSATGPDGRSGTQTAGPGGDLALAFQSRGDRAISELNSSFGNTPYPQAAHCNGKGDGINCDRRNGDPFTPIMRAYMNDHVKVKIQVGATEEQHQTTIHGFKWLSNGSGFGRSGNSGWRNFQSHGISEQFSLQVPITQDPNSPNATVDYLYAQDATRDGIWSGTWGLLRAYQNQQNDLFQLPNNPQRGGGFQFVNENDFVGVCPAAKDKRGRPTNTPANLRNYHVYAVLANDVLPNALGVTINGNVGGDSDGDGIGDNVGGPLDTAGGTLVFNRRGTVIADVVGEGGAVIEGGAGPLNDPTAMMYVLGEDLQPRGGYDANGIAVDERCREVSSGPEGWDNDMTLPGCPVELAPGAPVEPLVLRANAGDCIQVTLHNKLLDQAMANGSPAYYCALDADTGNCVAGTEAALFDAAQAQDVIDQPGMMLADANGNPVAMADITWDSVPDLAGWQDTFWVVNRDLFKPVLQRNQQQMSFFGNNLIAPSAQVGLASQLVKADGRADLGIQVGRNGNNALAQPGGNKTYLFYAGDVRHEIVGVQGNRTLAEYVATPVEFGASNLLSADRVKQPQKGLFGALVIEPQGASYEVDTLVADGQGSGDATRPTRAQMTINAGAPGDAGTNGTYRETLAIAHKITNLRWADGSAIKNVNQPEFGVEGAEDSGHAGYNYGMEPSWFRFKLPPDVPFGAAGDLHSYGSIPNPQAFYANALVAGEPNAIPDIPGVSKEGDPQTPVFWTRPDQANPVLDTRMFLLNGASADRDGTYILHGHVWQRDPHVCVGASQDSQVPLEGRCDPDEPVPSQALGVNPQAKYMGGEEGMGHVFGHWPILFDAGGTGAVKGDYLFRDYAPNGNRNGMFGILRVTDEARAPVTQEGGAGGGAGNPKKGGKNK